MSDPFDRALRAAARRSRPAGVCPDAAMLASYADNGLSADERRLVEAHAADCTTCLEHLALLGAVSVERDAPEPSRSWLTRWGWLVPVATAMLVVAVWIRLPDNERLPVAPAAPAASATQMAVPEQDRAATPGTSADQDETANQPRIAAKVGQAAPTPPARPAETRVDELAPLERRDTARQKAAVAPPSVASAPPAAPPVQAQEAGAEKAQTLQVGGATSKVASPAAAAAPGLADAIKEEVQVEESARRRETGLRTSVAATSPLVVSASPKEAYRAVGSRIELSEDGGTTWRSVLSDPQSAFTAAACAAGGSCWFGGADGQMLRRTPDGFSRSALPVRRRVVTIAPDGAQAALVTVEGGQRFRTSNGGTTWQPSP